MPQQPPPPQEYARVLLLILFFFILTSDNNVAPPGFAGSPIDRANRQLSRLHHSLDVLNTTSWQDFSPKTADTLRGESARYLNLTGFREQDGFAWDRLGTFWQRCDAISAHAVGRGDRIGGVYDNVTGIVNGRWARYKEDLPDGKEVHRRFNLSDVSPGVSWIFRAEEFWDRNITGPEGKLRLRINEKEAKELKLAENDGPGLDEQAREVTGAMSVQDESSSGDGWDLTIHGVHWPKQGAMLLTTTSDKFAGLFGLPHLTTNADYFASSKTLLNKTLGKTVDRLENAFWMDISNPWPSTPETQRDAAMPSPHCEFVVYVQVHPLSFGLTIKDYVDAASIVQQIEQELRFPTGAPIPEIPPLRMSAVIFSPDCGFMLESKGPPGFPSIEADHLEGRKQEIFLHKVQRWLLIFALVLFAQLMLLKMQSKEASTPSTIGRVSINSIAMLLMADGLLFSSLSLVSATSSNMFPSALLTAFAALMSIALGVRFTLSIYNTQEPERRERLRLQMAAQEASRPRPAPTPPTTIITAAGADTAPVNNTPIIIPSDQDIQAEIDEVTNQATVVPRPMLPTTNTPAAPPQPRTSNFVALYVQFVMGLTIILFLTLASLSWPVPIRTAYAHLLSGIYLSFWVPQIYRNVVRNCRKALLWKFVIGQSVLRLLPFAYFYLKEDNILFADPDPIAFSVLAAWVWIQILALIAQGVLGPRYAIPKGWTEEAWDYHPILREDNVEAGGMPIGLVQIPSSPTEERADATEEERKKNDSGIRTVDCAICMQVLEVPVIASGADPSAAAASGVVGILGRRLYMVTPCRHVFHSACLEGWMRFRLQCPICREQLPPL